MRNIAAAVIVAGVLALTACGGGEAASPATVTETVSATVTTTKTALEKTVTTTVTAESETTETATSPVSQTGQEVDPSSIELTCTGIMTGKRTSFRDSWAVYTDPSADTSISQCSANSNYGSEAAKLAEFCGSLSISYGPIITTPEQMAFATKALTVCPDHPKAAKIQASIDYAAEAPARVAAADERKAKVEAGTLVDDGSFLVGTDVQPGTWQSLGERVTDCYWEVSDSSGNIIDNNFISVAPQFTITVPSSASGFTVRGCSFERIGD